MEMYALIKFDRPIDKDRHVISPGGYEMTFNNGETVRFDFKGCSGRIDPADNRVFKCEMSILDIEAFPDSEFLKTFTGSVTAINEFFVYTGEVGDPEINPVELKALFMYNDKFETISVDRNLLANVFH